MLPVSSRIALVAFISISCVFACSPNKEPGTKENESNALVTSDSIKSDAIASIQALEKDSFYIQLDKKEFRKNEKIELKFTGSHYKQFAITDPDNVFYFIASDTLIKELPPVMSSQDFQRLGSFIMDIHSFGAFPYDNNAKEKIKVFKKSGEYKLIFGENLESEDLQSIIITIKIN